MQRGGRPSRQTRRTISRGTVETFIFTFPFRRAMNKCKGSKSEATRSLFLFRYASSLNLMARCYFRSTLSSMHTHTHTHTHARALPCKTEKRARKWHQKIHTSFGSLVNRYRMFTRYFIFVSFIEYLYSRRLLFPTSTFFLTLRAFYKFLKSSTDAITKFAVVMENTREYVPKFLDFLFCHAAF